MHFVYKTDNLFRSIRVSYGNSSVTKGFHFVRLIWTPDFLCVQNAPFKATSSFFICRCLYSDMLSFRMCFDLYALNVGSWDPCLYLWRPETNAPGVFQLFAVVAMSFTCVLHLAMSSSTLHHHVFKTCIRPGSLILSAVRFESNHTRPSAECPKYYFISGRKMFSEWVESWCAVQL